jgi:hypothetical protein
MERIKLKMRTFRPTSKPQTAFNQAFGCMKYQRARVRPISLSPLLLRSSRLSFKTIKEHYRKPLGSCNTVLLATGLLSFLRLNFYFLGWILNDTETRDFSQRGVNIKEKPSTTDVEIVLMFGEGLGFRVWAQLFRWCWTELRSWRKITANW